MKLHYAGASPFVRKVLVVAHELNLADQITLSTLAVTPVNPVDALNQANPLGKIPALELDDGMVLFDSRVITAHLNDVGGGALLPAAGWARLQAQVFEAMGDGMNDAMVLTRYETFLRPEELRWNDWIEQQLGKAKRAMDHLESNVDQLSTLTIGSISIACALAYADFRFPDLGWRDGRTNLAAWYADIAQRQAMQSTAPG